MIHAGVRTAILAGLAACGVFAWTAAPTAARAGSPQRGKIIDVKPDKPATPKPYTFPAVYRGTFDQIDETKGNNGPATAHETIKIHGVLDWAPPELTGDEVLPLPDRWAPAAPRLGNGPQRAYVVKKAILRVEFNLETANMGGRCASKNSPEQFTKEELPPSALDDFSLVVTSSGEYFINLAMRPGLLNVTDHQTCVIPGIPAHKSDDLIDDIDIRLRQDRGRMAYGVNGSILPEVNGARTRTGSWNFTAADK